MLPAPISGEPTAGRKLVPGAVNKGLSVMEFVSKLEDAEYVFQALRLPRPATQEYGAADAQ